RPRRAAAATAAAALLGPGSPGLARALQESPAARKLRRELNACGGGRAQPRPVVVCPAAAAGQAGAAAAVPAVDGGALGRAGQVPRGIRAAGEALRGALGRRQQEKGTIVFVADVGFDPPEAFEQRYAASDLEGGVVADRAFNVPVVLRAFWPQVEDAQARYRPGENPTRLTLDYTTPSRKSGTQGLRGAEVWQRPAWGTEGRGAQDANSGEASWLAESGLPSHVLRTFLWLPTSWVHMVHF
ncbi:unnamed protein product, partial [Prorocentrum cordatum]